MSEIFDMEQVKNKLCEIVSKVGREKFNSRYAHDCFCGDNPLRIGSFRVSTEVLDFIYEAVDEKIKRDDRT